ncbi:MULTISPECIES: DinB family protein [unclassified Halothiobacillus]|jgi:uncharacterized damage-inducible protein DinB|uniref:DinB family protein n=1 Tax=unclassified Halothiobacillus TaxID=2636392 RepID=UPI000BD7F7D5|nr:MULTISPECIES: DinB family protein [unclassified Halothiobacillus]MDD4966970.1 DinB family protein [Halothiobacillus sp.]OZB36133.1 MAG: hypothetical protein B7X44_07355 [Halothiobacillus sp. 15-55-196]OZB56839.1 MAG: hypothetical protein B7X35_03670 [Halothiobacillus sp. 14-56-357]
MSEHRQLLLQNEYNQWMNRQLYSVCGALPTALLNQDLGAFFHSITGTLNHLLLVDRLWLARMQGQSYPVSRLDDCLYENWHELTAERNRTDDDLTVFVSGLEPSSLDAPFRYTSLLSPEPRQIRLGDALLHLFHHQTHHRGQITTLLAQQGVDFGETDLLLLPGLLIRG